VNTITTFLSNHGCKDGLKHIRTDQGGELAGSAAFRKCVDDAKYTLEITESGALFQNGIVERQHSNLADMMRTNLAGANLSSDYWTWAIGHSVYLKNRLPHTAHKHHQTPYEMYTGIIPDLSHLRVFGSHVSIKWPSERIYKLGDNHVTAGIFLGFTATNRNIIFKDSMSQEIKTACHATFDEAYYSRQDKPPYAQNLLKIGDMPPTPNPPDASTSLKPMHSPPISPPHSTVHVIPLDDTSPVTTSQPTALPIRPDVPIINNFHVSTPDYILSTNPYGASVYVSINVKGDHPDLGMALSV
jgi:hypothetical protein